MIIHPEDIADMLGVDLRFEHDEGAIFSRIPYRSATADFYLALKAVDDLLAKYSAIKQDTTGAKWRAQSPHEHLQHCGKHAYAANCFVEEIGGCEEDLASTACRALMALQLYLEQKAQAPPPPPAR